MIETRIPFGSIRSLEQSVQLFRVPDNKATVRKRADPNPTEPFAFVPIAWMDRIAIKSLLLRRYENPESILVFYQHHILDYVNMMHTFTTTSFFLIMNNECDVSFSFV